MFLQISIVSQEPVLFNCSVEENIAYGFNGKASCTEIETVAVSLILFLPFLWTNEHLQLLLFSIYTDKETNVPENG